MRGVRKVLSFTDTPEGENEDKAGTATGDTSAIARISRGHDDVPESVGDYEIEMNSRINMRWVNTEEELRVECSRAGDGWRTEISNEEENYVVSRHEFLDDAVDAATALMSDEGADTGMEETAFDDEIESILEDVDAESVDAVEEAFGD